MLSASPDVSEGIEHICPVCGGPLGFRKDIAVVDEQIYFNGERLPMRKTAAAILSHLIKRKGMILGRNELWNYFYNGRPNGGPDPKIFDVYMTIIRREIDYYHLPIRVETVWGKGWILKDATR